MSKSCRLYTQHPLRKGFHRERAHPVLPNSTSTSAPPLTLGPCIPASSALNSSISWKLNQCFHKATCSTCLHKCCRRVQEEHLGVGGLNSTISFPGKGTAFKHLHGSLRTTSMCYSFPSPQPARSHHFPCVRCHSLQTPTSGANFHYRQKQTWKQTWVFFS